MSTPRQNHRQAVRVTSRILFTQTPATPERFERVSRDVGAGLSIYQRPGMEEILGSLDAQAALKRLAERDRDLALFLQYLDGRVGRLLKQRDGSASILDTMTLRTVNVSANGLAFWTEAPPKAKDLVELHLCLPSQSYINAFGEVVECVRERGEGDGEWRVSVRFLLIMEEDRERLVRYNFQQQTQILSQRRLRREGAAAGGGRGFGEGLD